MRLFDIVAELRDNISRIEASENPDESLLDSLDDSRYSLQDKLRACIGVARELDADAAFAKAEAARIAARGRSCEAQADRLRQRVFEALQTTGLPLPLRFAEFTVSVARNAPSA